MNFQLEAMQNDWRKSNEKFVAQTFLTGALPPLNIVERVNDLQYKMSKLQIFGCTALGTASTLCIELEIFYL